jgi:hypothetical protein
VPYLILGVAESGRLSFDFSRIEEISDRITPSFALSREALYEVLQGKAISVKRREDTIHLDPRESELVIQCNHAGKRREYRVWLAELAVGWNMLARMDGAQAA